MSYLYRWIVNARLDTRWRYVTTGKGLRTLVGLLGNAFFFLGSVCFFKTSLEEVAIEMFVSGSFLMLVTTGAELYVTAGEVKEDEASPKATHDSAAAGRRRESDLALGTLGNRSHPANHRRWFAA